MAGIISSMSTNIGNLHAKGYQPIIFIPSPVAYADAPMPTDRGRMAHELTGVNCEYGKILRDTAWRGERKPQHTYVAQPKLLRYIPPMYNETYKLDTSPRPSTIDHMPYNVAPPQPVMEDGLRNPFSVDRAAPSLITLPRTAQANLPTKSSLYDEMGQKLTSSYTPINSIPIANYPVQLNEAKNLVRHEPQLLRQIPKARQDQYGPPPKPPLILERPDKTIRLLRPIPGAAIDRGGRPPMLNTVREPREQLEPRRRVHSQFRVDARLCN